jgi:hypothetical protein
VVLIRTHDNCRNPISGGLVTAIFFHEWSADFQGGASKKRIFKAVFGPFIPFIKRKAAPHVNF